MTTPRRPYRTDLSDARWALLEPMLAEWRATRGGLGIAEIRHDLREIVNAVLYVNRTGIAWEYLPARLPALQDGVWLQLDETRIPAADAVRGACELLGLDPLHVAHAGVCVAFVPAEQADAALNAMHAGPEGRHAVAAGRVAAEHPGRVAVRTLIGAYRILDMLVGERLPRIC